MTRNCKLAAAAAVLALAVGAAAGADASVLTFDGDICNGGLTCSDSLRIDQTYGDTAAVDVQYNHDITSPANTTGAAGAELQWWDTGYNDLVNVAWGGVNDAAGTPMIFLKPVTGRTVTLNGFDLGGFLLAERETQVTIVDGLNNVLYASGTIMAGTGPITARHFSFNLSSATGIGIQWGPSGFNVGMDNVDFTTGAAAGVPEPATWAMLILGLGAAGSLIRHRRAFASS
ncbi:PEPxxWA-CTERM sorting domain-containing protein [Phenylobacterium sp.]|uniref:PEPxxWA-CTERM sorting domain-containing protein n=1 Tax=Phenylobacterium sp. TaxID=1871053 RepID=UPI0025D0D87D|nr:PEPxxWA-CTERM sorting domain-containing protein [Phenylobacterium sp.]